MYNYGYDYGYDYGAMGAILGFMVVFILIILGCYVLLYILRSIGLMTIARNRGMQYPWMTWIPIVGIYTLGAIADDIHAREGRQTYYKWLLLGGNILSLIFSSFASSFSIIGMMRILSDPESFYNYGALASGGLGWLGSLVSLAVYVITVISLYYIYKCYKPYSATSYTVLSAIPITSFMQSIYPFAIRNNQPNWINAPYPGGPGGSYAPPQGSQFQAPPPGGFQQPGGPPPPQAGPYQQPRDDDPPKQL